jgi:hypothetical protein
MTKQSQIQVPPELEPNDPIGYTPPHIEGDIEDDDTDND